MARSKDITPKYDVPKRELGSKELQDAVGKDSNIGKCKKD